MRSRRGPSFSVLHSSPGPGLVSSVSARRFARATAGTIQPSFGLGESWAMLGKYTLSISERHLVLRSTSWAE